MTVGSPQTSTMEEAKGYRSLRYTCLDDILTRGRETYDFPKEPCPAGIMAIHHFPAYVFSLLLSPPYPLIAPFHPIPPLYDPT
jgi:hypothetical protein